MTTRQTKAETRRISAVLMLLARGTGVLVDRSAAGPAAVTGPGGRAILHVSQDVVAQLDRNGLVTPVEGGHGISPEGMAYLRRHLGGDLGFLAQHLTLQAAGVEGALTNVSESPLAWLRNRKDKDGTAFIDEAQFAAGERLRADGRRAAIVPSTTARWDPTGVRGAGGPDTLLAGTLAARDRVNAALKAVGPELSGVLVDVCCFLKGLETVEGERGWPPRSARVVLGLGLRRLADHYGFDTVARGKAQAPLQAWRHPTAKPRPASRVGG